MTTKKIKERTEAALRRNEKAIRLKTARAAVGANVRLWREAQELTQENLATLSGVKRRTLQRIEKGESSMGLDELVELAHALGLKLLKLLP